MLWKKNKISTLHLGICFWIIKKSLWELWRTVRSSEKKWKIQNEATTNYSINKSQFITFKRFVCNLGSFSKLMTIRCFKFAWKLPSQLQYINILNAKFTICNFEGLFNLVYSFMSLTLFPLQLLHHGRHHHCQHLQVVDCYQRNLYHGGGSGVSHDIMWCTYQLVMIAWYHHLCYCRHHVMLHHVILLLYPQDYSYMQYAISATPIFLANLLGLCQQLRRYGWSRSSNFNIIHCLYTNNDIS